MGMAASQARFLGLTAKKSNLEYQGQQINEARMVLANQSSQLYTQMLGMKVPTPPNTEEYTKIQYSFTKPGPTGETCTINQIAADNVNVGKYVVQYTYTTQEVGFFKETDPTKAKYVTTVTAASWSVATSGGTTNLAQASTSGDPTLVAAANQLGTTYTTAFGGSSLTPAQRAANVYYVNVGTVAEPEYVYFDKSTLSTTPGDTFPEAYYQNGTYEKSMTTQYAGCSIEKTQDNRVSKIVLSAADGGYSLACNASTVTDNVAYENAMNQYTYENALYEQNLNEINSSIEIVQQQDRTLELQLKQLDTEQNAIQTEMDAVSKVLDKNVEDTFKTFS